MAKLMAVLPDQTVVTRETNNDYKFVVWHRSLDGKYFAWVWTATERRRDQLLRESQHSIEFGSIRACGVSPVSPVPVKVKVTRQPGHLGPSLRFMVPENTPQTDIDDMARYAGATAIIEDDGTVSLIGRSVFYHYTVERARSFGWKRI